MGSKPAIIAGTALALIFGASAHASAPNIVRIVPETGAPQPSLLLAQAQDEELTREERRKQRREQRQQEEEPSEEAPADEPAAPAPEASSPEAEPSQPAEEAAPEEQPAEEAPAATEDAPTEAEEPEAQEAPAEPETPEAPPAAEEPQPEAESPAAEEPQPEAESPAAEEPAADAPAEEEPQAESTPQSEEQSVPDSAEEPQEPASDEPEAEVEPEAPPASAAPAEDAPAAEEDDAPAAEQPSAAEDDQQSEDETEQPSGDGEAQSEAPAQNIPAGEPDAPADQPEASPADDAQSGDEAPAEADQSEADEEPARDAPRRERAGDGREAPVLDSQKEAPAPREGGEAEQQPAEAAPPPASDAEAQVEAQPQEIVPVTREEGRRVERPERRRERREGEDQLREIGDRIVIQFNNQIVVQSDERERLGRGAEDVYYEELPRGRVRETIARPNGVQVVTIRDRYGDVVRRSRIMPDGREYVLVYAGGRDGDRDGWRDPGRELPPLRLAIPYEEYVLDAGRARDSQAYYEFLDQPPVEPVQRLYSIDEVRYSARLRDSVRRVELDTITFEFGSASISEDAIPKLEGVAEAMRRMLEENPAETFLIEGHTDAVGTDEANLALSDQRAEAIAAALTNVFDIAPENLVTQGYGEEYLKIDTNEPEQQNRRVVMRRITPLVAPVASSE